MDSIVASFGVVISFLLFCSISVQIHGMQMLAISLECIALGLSIALIFMGDSALSSKENLEIIEAALRDVRQSRTASLSQIQNLAESERAAASDDLEVVPPPTQVTRQSTLARVGQAGKELLLRKVSGIVNVNIDADKDGDEPSTPMTPYGGAGGSFLRFRKTSVRGPSTLRTSTEPDSAERFAQHSASSPALQRSASQEGKRRSSFLKNKSKSTADETKTEELQTELSQSAHKSASATPPATGDSGDRAADGRASEGREKLQAAQAPCPNPEDVETVPTADLDGPESVLHFRNLVEQTVVIPNYSIPVTMDSEIFEGEMILMMRTDPPNKTFGPLFMNTKRLWWIQFQGKFKRPVDGDLYMGLEIDVFPQPGIMMRTFISVLLAFMKKIAGGRLFYQSSNNVVDTSRKKLGPESPFIVVPLAIGAGKITVTPPGEQEPKIGQAHDEEPEDYKYRQKTGQLRQGFNTDCVYTFSIYNAFVDFLGWTITNIPGCRPLDLNMMCQGRPFSIALYELNMEKTGKPHFSNFKTYMAKVQLQHERQMSPEELKEAREERQVLQEQTEKQHNEALLEIALQRMAEKDRNQVQSILDIVEGNS